MKELIIENTRISMHTPEDFGIVKEIGAAALISEISKELDKLSQKEVKSCGPVHIFINAPFESIVAEASEAASAAYIECGWKSIHFNKATDTIHPMTSVYLFY